MVQQSVCLQLPVVLESKVVHSAKNKTCPVVCTFATLDQLLLLILAITVSSTFVNILMGIKLPDRKDDDWKNIYKKFVIHV